MPDPVTVDHGGLTVTTNTASEADLRAELTRDAPPADAADAPAPAAAAAAGDAAAVPLARDEKGRFVKAEAGPSAAVTPSERDIPLPGLGHEASPESEKPALSRNTWQERLNKALEQRRGAEARAAALEQELARLRQPVTSPVTPPVYGQPATNGHGEPQFEQFTQEADPYTAYVQAWARWDNARQIEARFGRWEEERAAKAQHDTFTARIRDDAPTFPDWQEALTQADTLGLQVSEVMRAAITASPKAAGIVHYLATHPEMCTQLAEESIQTPVAAATVMQRLLESQVSAPAVASNGHGSAARSMVSTAKPPVKPIGSSPVVSDAPPGDDAPLAEHARYWNRKLKVPGTK